MDDLRDRMRRAAWAADRTVYENTLDAYMTVVGPELERLRAEAKQWHDTYQQSANSVDEFLGELLELLPGAQDSGSDAYDQIPRAIKALSAERDALEAAMRQHAAEAHRSKWAHQDTSPAAFDELHRLGDELLIALATPTPTEETGETP
jgi:hypothetical protein